MMSTTNLGDIGSRFIENIVKSIKNNFESEIEKYASDYAEAIKKKIKDEAILKLNNLRVEMVQSIDCPGLEIRIKVVE